MSNIDSARLTTLKIDARRGHNNVHDCAELLALLTLAERYLYVRENPSVTHYEHERHGTVGRVGAALDAAVDAARKGGGE